MGVRALHFIRHPWRQHIFTFPPFTMATPTVDGKDIAHFRHALAFLCAGVLLASALSPHLVGAQEAADHYSDVPEGAWYEDAASALLESGALDPSERLLRPQALATRAEVAKMLIRVSGSELVYPARASFVDVPKDAWYFPYIEAAARAGWMRGDGNCYTTGVTPCRARPADGVNRAEAAALLSRAFVLAYLNSAPVFSDNDMNQWYFIPVQTAADYCILQGDDVRGTVRPGAFMNRAEMIVMFDRSSADLLYGRDCGDGGSSSSALIQNVEAVSTARVRVTFSENVRSSIADNASQYSITVGNNRPAAEITSVMIVGARIVELRLDDELLPNTLYTLTARNIQTEEGDAFTDSEAFRMMETATGEISSIEAVNSTRVRVTFSSDVRVSTVNTLGHYTLTTTSGTRGMDIDSANVVNERTVDLLLDDELETNVSYTLTTRDIELTTGQSFTDSETFRLSGEQTGNIIEVEAVSSTRIILNFDVDLSDARADEESRYRITGPDGELDVSLAIQREERVVELTLREAMEAQESYTIEVIGLETDGGTIFSDEETIIFNSGSSTTFSTELRGSLEVPSVTTPGAGSGTFTLTENGLLYDITVRNLTGGTITAAHFHRAAAGVSGPVVEPITFTNNRATGTWIDLTPEERHDILEGRIYVNVHNAKYPDGEIRGQIVRN